MINSILSIDNHSLIQVDSISGVPVFKVTEISGVRGVVKNLIFASKGYKPEIVLGDALNNDIRIVNNEDSCLVFDKAISTTGLKWVELVDWWSLEKDEERSLELAKGLLNRLRDSLDSRPEVEFFNIYYSHYGGLLGKELPALIPQVYLHYDPYSIRKHGIQYLLRQRMDFLILFSNSKRVVIEIDGKQHYSNGDISSPAKYSEMVRLDRELKFLNYDVYRIGGHELTYDTKKTTLTFFNSLFEKYL